MQTEERAYESSVNLPELLARLENDRELLCEVLEIFTEEFPVLQVRLKDALARGELREVGVAAHTLKGMLASLSFVRASTSAMWIERMAAELAPDGIAAEMVELEHSVAQGAESLKSVCREHGGGEVTR